MSQLQAMQINGSVILTHFSTQMETIWMEIEISLPIPTILLWLEITTISIIHWDPVHLGTLIIFKIAIGFRLLVSGTMFPIHRIVLLQESEIMFWMRTDSLQLEWIIRLGAEATQQPLESIILYLVRTTTVREHTTPLMVFSFIWRTR